MLQHISEQNAHGFVPTQGYVSPSAGVRKTGAPRKISFGLMLSQQDQLNTARGAVFLEGLLLLEGVRGASAMVVSCRACLG